MRIRVGSFFVGFAALSFSSHANATALTDLVEQVLGVKIPNAKEGVTIPIPGVYTIGTTPFVIGHPEPTKGINLTIAPDQLKVATPLSLANTPAFNCKSSLTFTATSLAIACDATIGLQQAHFEGTLKYDFKYWELGGWADMKVLGASLGRLTAQLKPNGIKLDGSIKIPVIGEVKVDGSSSWSFDDWSLKGSAHLSIGPLQGAVAIEVGSPGVTAEFSLLGLTYRVGPVRLSDIYNAIKKVADAVGWAFDQLKKVAEAAINLGKDAAKAAAKAGEAAVNEAADAAKAAWDTARAVATAVGETLKRIGEALGKLACKTLKFATAGLVDCTGERDRLMQERADAEAQLRAAEEAAREADRKREEAERIVEEEKRIALAPVIEAETTVAAMNLVSKHGLRVLFDCSDGKGQAYFVATAQLVATKQGVTETAKRAICRRWWEKAPQPLKDAWADEIARQFARDINVGPDAIRACFERAGGPFFDFALKWADHPFNRQTGPMAGLHKFRFIKRFCETVFARLPAAIARGRCEARTIHVPGIAGDAPAKPAPARFRQSGAGASGGGGIALTFHPKMLEYVPGLVCNGACAFDDCCARAREGLIGACEYAWAKTKCTVNDATTRSRTVRAESCRPGTLGSTQKLGVGQIGGFVPPAPPPGGGRLGTTTLVPQVPSAPPRTTGGGGVALLLGVRREPIGSWKGHSNNYKFAITIRRGRWGILSGSVTEGDGTIDSVRFDAPSGVLEFRRIGSGWWQWYRLTVSGNTIEGTFSHESSPGKPGAPAAYRWPVRLTRAR